MKILIVGGNGTIGRKVTAHLAQKHEIIVAGRSQGDVKMDMRDSESIEKTLAELAPLDAIVCIAGEARWARLDDLSEEDFYIGIRSKMMGQVNLVRLGKAHLNPGGSFTLTTGVLADDPVDMTTSAAMVNGALHSFTLAAALEMENGQRINVVSAGLVEDAVDKYQDYFPGHTAVPMHKVVDAYVKCIEGRIQGQIVRVYN